MIQILYSQFEKKQKGCSAFLQTQRIGLLFVFSKKGRIGEALKGRTFKVVALKAVFSDSLKSSFYPR
jgi:hypothetical protein